MKDSDRPADYASAEARSHGISKNELIRFVNNRIRGSMEKLKLHRIQNSIE